MSRFGPDLLERVNRLLSEPFGTLEELLAFYRRELPLRVGDYHQDEVGPVMHHDRPGEADRFVRGVFCLGESTLDMSAEIARRQASGRRPFIDWYATPNRDLEWNGALARHGYFTLLAAEYRKTAEERFARTVIEHLLDYIEGVPPFAPEGKSYLEYKRSTWRPFEAAARAAETWPEALAAVIGSPVLRAEAWAVILLSVHEHACFLRRNHWQTGNHAALEVAALGVIAIFFRELREAASWRGYAVEFLQRIWPRLFHRDGYSREMSGGYHWVAIRSYLAYHEVAQRSGFSRLFSNRCRKRLALSALAELYQDKPDYSTPVTNDSNSLINRRAQLERMGKGLDLPQIAFRLSGGKTGRAVEPASRYLPWARVGIMRSDWTAQALYLFFDMGRWGDNHMNEDQLHVELSAFGRNFLAGSGRWRYTTSDPDAAWMPWARYFKTTSAYNSVILDGYNQMPGDARGRMVVGRRLDYAEGSFAAGYGEERAGSSEALLRGKGLATSKVPRLQGVVHSRKILFLKPHLWLLRDDIDLRGARESGPAGGGASAEPGDLDRRRGGQPVRHTATQIWHFVDGELTEISRGCYATRFPDANLLILSLASRTMHSEWFQGREQPMAGWHCPCYDRKQPAPELRFQQSGAQRLRFHTLLAPFRSPRPPLVPQLELLDHGYRIRHWAGVFTVRTPARGIWSVSEQERPPASAPERSEASTP